MYYLLTFRQNFYGFENNTHLCVFLWHTPKYYVWTRNLKVGLVYFYDHGIYVTQYTWNWCVYHYNNGTTSYLQMGTLYFYTGSKESKARDLSKCHDYMDIVTEKYKSNQLHTLVSRGRRLVSYSVSKHQKKIF